MSKRSKRKGPPKARHQRPQRVRQHRGRPPESTPEDELFDGIAAALEDDEPLPILGLASSLLEALDPPRNRSWEQADDAAPPPADEVLDGFLQIPLVETSALLTAVAGLRGDDVLAQRVRREVAARGDVLPRWLTHLDRTTVGRVMELRDPLRDGDDIFVELALPGGQPLTIVVYIDYNMGTLAKDAFVLPTPLDQVLDLIREDAADPDAVLAEIDPGDGRARITDAVELWSISVPPIESDTWPACRPIVMWALRMLPEGGRGYERPEWSDADLTALGNRFFASEFGQGLDDADHHGLLQDLLWYGTDYGAGDPLRLSGVNAEMLLLDWVPRKIVADVAYLRKFPGLLRAFIRFGHAEAGIRAELTEDALAAVDEYEPEYQQTIRSARPQGAQALLVRMGVGNPADLITEEMLDQLTLEGLRDAVGGDDALASLDAEPLPDEPFDWHPVPDDVHGRVGEVLALADRCCDEMLDAEVRTAARRLLAAVAAGDPQIFRGRARADTAAATICWLVGQANELFRERLTVKDLLAFFGVGSGTPGQRAKKMLPAIGMDYDGYGPIHLGSPGYLIAQQRREIIRIRDTVSTS